MNYILYDGPHRETLLPLTFTRPVAGIRIGITTIREKWENYLGQEISHLTQDYLQKKFTLVKGNENIVIDGSVLPNDGLVSQIKSLKHGQALVNEGRLLAANVSQQQLTGDPFQYDFEMVHTETECISIQNPWDVFKYNAEAIKDDFERLTSGRISSPFGDKVWVSGNPGFDIYREKVPILNMHISTLRKGRFISEKMLRSWKGVKYVAPLHCVRDQH